MVVTSVCLLGNQTLDAQQLPQYSQYMMNKFLINPAVANGAATTQEAIMGVTTRAIAASQYFWAQTWGLCALQMDIDAAAGAEANEVVIQSGTTAGRGLIIADTHVPGGQIIGNNIESADLTDAEASLVFLTIS